MTHTNYFTTTVQELNENDFDWSIDEAAAGEQMEVEGSSDVENKRGTKQFNDSLICYLAKYLFEVEEQNLTDVLKSRKDNKNKEDSTTTTSSISER